ncbi:hypothetical protein BGX34_011393 [Mortierella sp. NVP85]|nr:hypothetical protein BGX34_011393 [Mortierella sp. NVP85]
MLCFSISEQEIENALSKSKAAFCNSTTAAGKPANLEECVKALKTAVDTFTKIKKDGKRALDKDENIDLRKEIVDVYKELTQLQGYLGPDKAQKCFEFAGKWRNGVNNPDSIQPPPPPQPQPQQLQPQPQPQPELELEVQLQPQFQPPPQPSDHENGESDSASMSSDDSRNIPAELFPPTMAPTSGGIHNYEEDPVGDTHGPKEVESNVPQVEVFNGGLSDPNLSNSISPSEQHVKNPGEFPDAAPRTAPSFEDLINEPLPDTSSISPENVDPRKEQPNEADQDESKTIGIAERTESGGRTVITERDEVGGLDPAIKAIPDVAEPLETTDRVPDPVNDPKGKERTAYRRNRYIDRLFGLSVTAVKRTLEQTKNHFYDDMKVATEEENPDIAQTQCDKALSDAVNALTNMEKDGKRALKKDQVLKGEIVDACSKLKELQSLGENKVQVSLRFAKEWRGNPFISDLQREPPVHENEESVDDASISSGGTHSIPDQFYQASLASGSSGIDAHDEENPSGNTPGSSDISLNVSSRDEPNDDPWNGRFSHVAPREQYQKSSWGFADAAP